MYIAGLTDDSYQFSGATDEVRVWTIGFGSTMNATHVINANDDRPLTDDPEAKAGIYHDEHGGEGELRVHS